MLGWGVDQKPSSALGAMGYDDGMSSKSSRIRPNSAEESVVVEWGGLLCLRADACECSLPKVNEKVNKASKHLSRSGTPGAFKVPLRAEVRKIGWKGGSLVTKR